MINLIINSLVIIKTIILTIWLQFWDCNRLFFFFHFFIRKKNLSYTSSREWYVEYAWHDSKISRHELVGAKQTVKVGGGGLAEGVIRHILPPRSRGEISRRFTTTLGWTGYMQTTNRWEINLNETNLRGYRQPGRKYFIFLSFSFHSLSILL